MTAIIGFCTERGAFLAADTQQTDPMTLKAYPQRVKKIVRLASWAVVGVSGNGMLEHAQRSMVDSIGSETAVTSLEQSMLRIGRTMRDSHRVSAFGLGKSSTPMAAVVAGHDRATGRGFLCVFGNSNDFEPQFVIGHGLRIAEGINPPLIRDTVIAVTDEFRRTESRLPLDRWAVESLKRISKAGPGVGLPAHVAIVDEHDAIIHEADCDTPTQACFVVDFRPINVRQDERDR